MMTNIKIIIVHGAYGHAQENWFEWLRQELSKLKISCLVPTLPTPEGQSLDNWLKCFSDQCESWLDKKTILIGHSLGAAFVLRWLEQNNHPIQAAILVSPFLGKVGIAKFDLINQTFFQNPINWQKLKSRANQFIMFYGDNDPYVIPKHFNFISSHLAATNIAITAGGHLNTAAGFEQFPQLLNYIKQYIKENSI